jgi:hypothetical protein
MLSTDDRYKRGHCVYGNCQYYEFTPGEEGMIGPVIPKEEIVLKNLPENQSERLMSTVNKIKGWNYTHESRIVSNWPWIYDNNEKAYVLSPEIPEDYFLVKKDNPWSVLNTSSATKDIAEELPTMAWLQIHGWHATYCNFFAQDLSLNIFGFLPWGAPKRANEIHDYISNSVDFIEIEFNDIDAYKLNGYIIYFTQKGTQYVDGSFDPGHIATGWAENDQAIQAGEVTDIINPTSVFNSDRLKINLYLGFLRTRE